MTEQAWQSQHESVLRQEPESDGDSADVAEFASSDVARRALNQARAAAGERGLRPTKAGTTFKKKRTTNPAQFSGAGYDARDPQPFGSVLKRLLGDLGWRDDVAVGDVIGRWRDIVGPEISKHCEPERFEDGELVIRASSTAWATQMRRLTPTLITRLHEDIGRQVVTGVTVKGPAPKSWKKGARTVKGWRGPRDTYG